MKKFQDRSEPLTSNQIGVAQRLAMGGPEFSHQMKRSQGPGFGKRLLQIVIDADRPVGQQFVQLAIGFTEQAGQFVPRHIRKQTLKRFVADRSVFAQRGTDCKGSESVSETRDGHG